MKTRIARFGGFGWENRYKIGLVTGFFANEILRFFFGFSVL